MDIIFLKNNIVGVLQTLVSVIALGVSIYVLKRDTKRYSEENKISNQNFNKQISILEEHKKSFLSILKQLKSQSEISKLQLETEQTITQPQLNCVRSPNIRTGC